MTKRISAAGMLMVLVACGAFAQTDPNPLDAVLTTAKTSVQTNLVAVIGAGLALFALALGAGLIMRWLSKAAKKA